ncbi:hypothetical protein P167DRAFT_75201 [Morchella conica CCBAS932]|uniref:Uncharacterized protein n=1 Tax=Morchella conica CCBAS932 TaxID=1392247 RepID=A0A3N4L0L4_9PEZI|nr:hypothetical protein P167DRAFT_75201 [Morchella conica CCBAS932]
MCTLRPLRASGSGYERLRSEKKAGPFRFVSGSPGTTIVWWVVRFRRRKVLFIVSFVVLGRKQQEQLFLCGNPNPCFCLFVGAGRAVLCSTYSIWLCLFHLWLCVLYAGPAPTQTPTQGQNNGARAGQA